MRSRFGARSGAVREFQTKVKFLVGFLISTVLFLILMLGFVLNANMLQKSEAATPIKKEKEKEADVTVVNVLVSSQRIEKGAQVTNSMIRTAPMPLAEIGSDTLLEKDKASILGMSAKELILASTPIRHSKFSREVVETFDLPDGYRAITITVSPEDGSPFLTPSDRVDVVWTFHDRSRKLRVAKIVPGVKILAIGGSTIKSQKPISRPTSVTLAVKELDARRVQLARTSGKLSLSLMGVRTNPFEDPMIGVTEFESMFPDIFPPTVASREKLEGEMCIRDKHSGRKVRVVKPVGKVWRRDGGPCEEGNLLGLR